MNQTQAVLDGEISPSQVPSEIGGTCLRKREVERLLERIINQQRKANPDRWTCFSEEDVARACGYQHLPLSEQQLLDLLVSGGQLPSHPGVTIEPGYLEMLGPLYLVAEPLRKVFKDCATIAA